MAEKESFFSVIKDILLSILRKENLIQLNKLKKITIWEYVFKQWEIFFIDMGLGHIYKLENHLLVKKPSSKA